MTTTLCNTPVELDQEITQVLENLNSREPGGCVADMTPVAQRWWGDEPALPVKPLYPHHEDAQLDDRFMRWLKVSGWVNRHPTEIANRIGLTAITWVIPGKTCLSNYAHCCVTQVTQQGVIEGRAYRFWMSLAPELRPKQGEHAPRDFFQPVELGLNENVVVFKNLLDTPGWWPVECLVTNANKRRERGRWEDFPFKKNRTQLQEERDACNFQFEELEIPPGTAPWTLQDPAAEGFVTGLEALVAWGESEIFAPWLNHPAGNHPDKDARFDAANSLLHQVNKKHEVVMPQANVIVDRNYLGQCAHFVQKKQFKKRDTLVLPFQYLLPAGKQAVDLPQLDLFSPYAGAAYPQVLLDFANVPSHQVVRMSAFEMDKARQQNFDWKRMYSPKREINPWEEFQQKLLQAIRENDVQMGEYLLKVHPGYAAKLSGINPLYVA